MKIVCSIQIKQHHENRESHHNRIFARMAETDSVVLSVRAHHGAEKAVLCTKLELKLAAVFDVAVPVCT